MAGDSYIRRISKYEIDRNEIDFNKLRKEKEADRTKNVKINKQIIDHNLDGRHLEEVRATDYKIALLS